MERETEITRQKIPARSSVFTAEEIADLLPVQEILEEDEETGEVRILMKSITFAPLAKRIFAFYGITEKEVETGKYESAWIDVRVTANKKIRQAISLTFDIVANTGDNTDDRELCVYVTTADEGRQIYDMIAEGKKMKKYKVTRVVTGTFIVTVNASSAEEAVKIATDMYENADFGGQLTNTGWYESFINSTVV